MGSPYWVGESRHSSGIFFGNGDPQFPLAPFLRPTLEALPTVSDRSYTSVLVIETMTRP